jgi:hypothetical protein
MISLPASNIHRQEWLGLGLSLDSATIDWLRTMGVRCAGVLITIATSLLLGCQSLPQDRAPLIEGIVWQLDNATVNARGNWHDIGAKTLLVQWISVDGINFMHDEKKQPMPHRPDWRRIGAEPWAQSVILGLAGRFDESSARAEVVGLIAESARLAKLPTPLHVVGWYFPVEVDSSWAEVSKLGKLLTQLPRPLWISVYDSRNIGATNFARWLTTWLPADIGVFFQDGVGVETRTAPVARQYAEALSRQLGTARVKVIAEAFRPKPEGGFRSATFDELSTQLSIYRGIPIYLFDGPHYVSNQLVDELKNQFNK